MNIKKRSTILLHPLAGSSFRNWIKLLLENGGIDKKYLLRAIMVSFLSLLGSPFRTFERAKFDKKVEAVQIEFPPIFIIGHWRSGTTYLHRLMSLDENLGYVSNFQTFLPGVFLGSQKIGKTILNRLLPETRLIDNMKYPIDSPEEEEYALGNLCPYSFINCWYFPKQMTNLFKEFVLFDEISDKNKNQWKNVYIKVIKKITFTNGKRLVIKNPSNTARIKVLLEIFPDAKFIHIYRNPYVVYASTKNLYNKLLALYTFQDVKQEDIEKNIFDFYREMMQKFFSLKNLIPPENFFEIKYEDFENNEIEELEKVYRKFKFTNFEQVKEKLESYIASQSNYQKNNYVLDRETLEKIDKNWGFAIEKWQYSVPKELVKNQTEAVQREENFLKVRNGK